jgi:hypothetical protein
VQFGSDISPKGRTRVQIPLGNGLDLEEEGGEVQRTLNQKVSSKFSGAVDFGLRFVIIFQSTNFKIRIY